MSLRARDLVSEVSVIGQNSHAVYYAVGQAVSVIVNRVGPRCMTDHRADCAHAEAVMLYREQQATHEQPSTTQGDGSKAA